MEIRESNPGYVIGSCLFGDDSPLVGDNISLLDNGIIDSVGVMELVAVGFVSRKRRMV